jgi:hypothetical protein
MNTMTFTIILCPIPISHPVLLMYVSSNTCSISAVILLWIAVQEALRIRLTKE